MTVELKDRELSPLLRVRSLVTGDRVSGLHIPNVATWSFFNSTDGGFGLAFNEHGMIHPSPGASAIVEVVTVDDSTVIKDVITGSMTIDDITRDPFFMDIYEELLCVTGFVRSRPSDAIAANSSLQFTDIVTEL
jgi:hypothetical protein